MKAFFILLSLGGLVLAVTLLSGCAPLSDVGNVSAAQPVPVRSYREDYKLAPLDQVQVYHGSEEPTVLTINDASPIYYPSGEKLNVIGLSPDEVSRELRQRDPSIQKVEFEEYQANRLTVTGEVNIQTTFDIPDAPTHVLDAIATAGGFTPLADPSEVRLVRHNAGTVQVFELDMRAVQHGRDDNLNLLLKPGDRIFVPKSFL